MSEKDILKYWMNGAIDALDTAKNLFDDKKFNHSLFFLHLALEKAIKGVFFKLNNESPPYDHDLVRLGNFAEIKFSDEENEQLREISTFNIAGRYDDYKLAFYKKANAEFAKKWFIIGEKLFAKVLELYG